MFVYYLTMSICTVSVEETALYKHSLKNEIDFLFNRQKSFADYKFIKIQNNLVNLLEADVIRNDSFRDMLFYMILYQKSNKHSYYFNEKTFINFYDFTMINDKVVYYNLINYFEHILIKLIKRCGCNKNKSTISSYIFCRCENAHRIRQKWIYFTFYSVLMKYTKEIAPEINCSQNRLSFLLEKIGRSFNCNEIEDIKMTVEDNLELNRVIRNDVGYSVELYSEKCSITGDDYIKQNYSSVI